MIPSNTLRLCLLSGSRGWGLSLSAKYIYPLSCAMPCCTLKHGRFNYLADEALDKELTLVSVPPQPTPTSGYEKCRSSAVTTRGQWDRKSCSTGVNQDNFPWKVWSPKSKSSCFDWCIHWIWFFFRPPSQKHPKLLYLFVILHFLFNFFPPTHPTVYESCGELWAKRSVHCSDLSLLALSEDAARVQMNTLQ